MQTDGREEHTYHHGDLRRALLDAALELILAEGMTGLSLRAVARRARVSHAAPYHHFDSRAALVAAVAEEGFRELREAMLARMEGTVDPARQVQESGIGYVMFAIEREAYFRVMHSAELADKEAFPSLQAAGAAAYAVLDQALARCREAGYLPADETGVQGQAAWALVHGLAMLLVDGHLPLEGASGGEDGDGPAAGDDSGADDDSAAAESLAREVTGLLWNGLTATPDVNAR